MRSHNPVPLTGSTPARHSPPPPPAAGPCAEPGLPGWGAGEGAVPPWESLAVGLQRGGGVPLCLHCDGLRGERARGQAHNGRGGAHAQEAAGEAEGREGGGGEHEGGVNERGCKN